jgi:hypothetical protein
MNCANCKAFVAGKCQSSWNCPNCGEIAGCNVTYSEHCTFCHCRVNVGNNHDCHEINNDLLASCKCLTTWIEKTAMYHLRKAGHDEDILPKGWEKALAAIAKAEANN